MSTNEGASRADAERLAWYRKGPADAGADRLAWYVYHRRKYELDLNQLEVGQAGGPSNTTLTKIENGHLETLERSTARKLDVGLQWESGSARRVWEGGEPVPIADLADLRRRVVESPYLTDEQKRRTLMTWDSAPEGEVTSDGRSSAI